MALKLSAQQVLMKASAEQMPSLRPRQAVNEGFTLQAISNEDAMDSCQIITLPAKIHTVE